MNAEDMIFESVYKPAMKVGASERAAKDCAVKAVIDFKRSNFKTLKTLIDDAIKTAKKL